MRRRDFIWDECPPGFGDPKDRPGDEESLSRTAALDEETYTERPAHEYYDDAVNEDIARSWDDAHYERARRRDREYAPPYTDWEDIGEFRDHNGKLYKARFRREGRNYWMGQAIDPDVDHSLDNANDDHEAVIKWGPHEIGWRGTTSTAHRGGFLSMALKHHLHENIPDDVPPPRHSTNLTDAGRGSLETYLDRHGDPYGDIEDALRGYREDHGYDDDDDDDYEDDDPEPEGPDERQRRRLYNHGFREDNIGHWGKDFYDHNGDVLESHDIDPDGNLRVYTRGLDGNMIHNNHASHNYAYDFDDAMEHSRHGFAERHLPGEGWIPHYREPALDYRNFQSNQGEPNREDRHLRPYQWTKTTEVQGDRPYESTISLPNDHRGDSPAFTLETHRQGMPDKLTSDNEDLLGKGGMLNEERDWVAGKHTGGRRDFRLTHGELRDAMTEHFGREPHSVGRFRSPEFYPENEKADDAYVSSAPTNIGRTTDQATGMYYNWDTGRYEGTNGYGKVTIPGRQMALPLERHMPVTSASSVKSSRGIGRASDSIFMGFWSL